LYFAIFATKIHINYKFYKKNTFYFNILQNKRNFVAKIAMVIGEKNGITHNFSCDEWALIDPSSGWVAVSSDCGATYFNTVQSPYASYDLPLTANADKNFTFVQSNPAAEWTVVHNLGKFPSVTVFDTAGTQWITNVEHINKNICIIKCSAPFSGTATLN
jgi:hypothetical protein